MQIARVLRSCRSEAMIVKGSMIKEGGEFGCYWRDSMRGLTVRRNGKEWVWRVSQLVHDWEVD